MSYIPDEIVFIYTNKSSVSRRLDNKTETVFVIPAFVSDAANAKTIQTGVTWAESDWRQPRGLKAKMQQMKMSPKEDIGYLI